MNWADLPRKSKIFLVAIDLIALPLAAISLLSDGKYTLLWFLLTLASLFVATVHLSLPRFPGVVISMGDVFTVLALIQFGPGPALLTYWANVTGTALSGYVKRHGFRFLSAVKVHRLVFNLACSALSVWGMDAVFKTVKSFGVPSSATFMAALMAMTTIWFVINTVTLSAAVSLSSGQKFRSVWGDGFQLYILNFFGSSATAGLISLFYERAGFVIFLLSVPIAVVIYQLYYFYVQRFLDADRHIADLNSLYLQTIEALATAVDAKDRYTHGHIRRVEAYATALAKLLGIKAHDELMAIKAGALLHDIGKIAVPEYILNKPTLLTESEFEKMKLHPVAGASMLKGIKFPYPVVPIVKWHHERWDGNGYPDGLKEQEIPVSARILSLVDCYDALTTNRPYRSPMPRAQIVEFFQREAGKAYDPSIVKIFLENLDAIAMASQSIAAPDVDLWGMPQHREQNNIRSLEKVQPSVSYRNALKSDPEMQRELFSIFEFAHAELQWLKPSDVFAFIGARLSNLVAFDGCVFFRTDATRLVAGHVIGRDASELKGLTVSLEQKLSGWVAANNQALCNLPPFPDFLGCTEPRPEFQLSAIAPMNRAGTVYGAISLYRKDKHKFSEEEFRRLEIVSSQTAFALSKLVPDADETPLTDPVTGLPNTFQLHLMFDQIVMDAHRYEYAIAALSIHLDEAKTIRRRWGTPISNDSLKAVSASLTSELRDTDVLIRYSSGGFFVLCPRMTRNEAEALKSRLQDGLDRFRFSIRSGSAIPLRASIGISMYPDDAANLEGLLSIAEWRMQEDLVLRQAVIAKTDSAGRPSPFSRPSV